MKKIRILVLGIILLLTFVTCGLIQQTSNDYTDPDETPAVLIFAGSADDAGLGELYYQSLNTEKEQIADNVKKDEYLLMPETKAILYLDNEGILYLKQQGIEKEIISDQVVPSSFTYSEDETTISFLRKADDKEDSLSELYIKKIGLEKEKITSDMKPNAGSSLYNISKDASEIFYVNNDKVLYKKTASGDKEKIDSDVSAFTVNADSTAYSYLNYQNYYYVKWPNDTEAQIVASDNVGNLRLSQNGSLAAFTGSYNYEKGFGELYVVIRGGDAVKIASDVKSFYLSADGESLYYINDEDAVYLKTLSPVNEKTYKDQLKFIDDVNDTEKIKLCSDVSAFEVSADGKNCVMIDNDSNLYLSYDQKEKVKVASDVKEGKVFVDSLIYINEGNQLFLNSKISDTKHAEEKSVMIAQSISGYATSNYGKYIMFTDTDQNAISVCNDGQTPEVIVSDFESFDKVVYNGTAVFDKKLKLSDINGIYKNETLGVAYKITSEGAFTLYELGVEKESTEFIANGTDKFTLYLNSDNKNSVLAQNSYSFIKKADGTAFMSVNGIEYALVALTDVEMTKEIERQKQTEATRVAEEEKKAKIEAKKLELSETGKTYMKSGIYVAKGQKLYFSPDYSNTSSLTNTVSGMKDVYGYEVSTDGSTLWLKLYSVSASGGYAGYVWVSESHTDM